MKTNTKYVKHTYKTACNATSRNACQRLLLSSDCAAEDGAGRIPTRSWVSRRGTLLDNCWQLGSHGPLGGLDHSGGSGSWSAAWLGPPAPEGNTWQRACHNLAAVRCVLRLGPTRSARSTSTGHCTLPALCGNRNLNRHSIHGFFCATSPGAPTKHEEVDDDNVHPAAVACPK